MPEPISAIASLVSIFKSLWAGIRTLRQGRLSDQNKEAVENIATLLTDAQDRLSDLQTESIELREQNAELVRQIAEDNEWHKTFSEYHLVTTEGGAVVYQKTYTRKTTIVAGVYGGDPDHTEHYVCPSCVSQMQLQILQDNRDLSGAFTCPSCDVKYLIKPKRTRSKAKVITRRP